MILNNILLPVRRWHDRRNFFRSRGPSSDFFGRFRTYGEAQQFAKRYSNRVEYHLGHGEQLIRLSEGGESLSAALTCLKKIAYPGMRVARLAAQTFQDSDGEDGYARYEGLENLVWLHLEGLEQNTTLSSLQLVRIVFDDVLLAQGVLPYMRSDLPTELLTHDAQPAHLILGGLALSDCAPFVTLHNVDGWVTPFRVDNAQALIDSLGHLGYHLVSQWRDMDSRINLPQKKDARVEFGYGMHFQHGHRKTP